MTGAGRGIHQFTQGGERMNRWKPLLTTSMPLVGLLGVAFLIDFLVAATTSLLFLCGVAAIGVLIAGLAWACSHRTECLVPLLPFAMLLALLSLLDTSPLKPFGRFYAAIELGMTEKEVLNALDQQFPSTGRYPRPVLNRRIGPNHLAFILDPKDGQYDAEIVALDLKDGQVVEKMYYPD